MVALPRGWPVPERLWEVVPCSTLSACRLGLHSDLLVKVFRCGFTRREKQKNSLGLKIRCIIMSDVLRAFPFRYIRGGLCVVKLQASAAFWAPRQTVLPGQPIRPLFGRE